MSSIGLQQPRGWLGAVGVLVQRWMKQLRLLLPELPRAIAGNVGGGHKFFAHQLRKLNQAVACERA